MRAFVPVCLTALVVAFCSCHGRSTGADDAGPSALAAKDLSAPKRPPGLRVAHMKVPPLPDLPALSAHVLVEREADCHATRWALQELLRERFGLEHTTLQVDHEDGGGLLQLRLPEG